MLHKTLSAKKNSAWELKVKGTIENYDGLTLYLQKQSIKLGLNSSGASAPDK